MHPVSCTNTHHDVTDLVNNGMVKNTKTWIPRERNTTFLWKKKFPYLCLRWHILRSYRFVAEVTFKTNPRSCHPFTKFQNSFWWLFCVLYCFTTSLSSLLIWSCDSRISNLAHSITTGIFLFHIFSENYLVYHSFSKFFFS